jgi:beta-glucosidase
LPWLSFQIVDANATPVVEPGAFEILAGPSSRDADLLKASLTIA